MLDEVSLPPVLLVELVYSQDLIDVSLGKCIPSLQVLGVLLIRMDLHTLGLVAVVGKCALLVSKMICNGLILSNKVFWKYLSTLA